MKVLFLNYEYPPLGGGAANATFYILREFSRIPDLEVDLVTSSVDENFSLEKIGDRINIHRLPIGKKGRNLHFQSQKDLLIYSWKAYWYSRKLIRKNKYDLAHSFFSVPCGFISLIFKWRFRVPYIISLRGADVPGYSERFSCIYNIIKPIIKLVWSNANDVIANSQGLKDLALKSKPDQKIKIIYNGIDIQIFKPDPDLKPQDKFILTLGGSRLTARKGTEYLIEAISKLIIDYPDIYLKIIGEGDEKENLKRLVSKLKLEKQVSFIGRVSKDKMPFFYQEASVFVLPSLNEGMSNAMLEALASGLPIISTPTGGAEELVEDKANGFIIKFKNSNDIADKIEKLIKNPELIKQMGEASRKKAEGMSWKKVAKGYYNLYKK